MTLLDAPGDGEDDHRLNRSAQALHQKIVAFASGKPVTEGLIRGVEDLVSKHQRDARLIHGIAFPDMTVMFVARVGYLQIVRRDLDEKGLAVVLKNITNEYPGVSALDLARAVARAFPNFRPGNVVR